MRIHFVVSVDIDRFSDAMLRKDWLPLFRANGVATVKDIREACAEMRAQGYEVFPNKECDNLRPDGSCGGHP